MFRLLYALQIIESLVEINEGRNEGSSNTSTKGGADDGGGEGDKDNSKEEDQEEQDKHSWRKKFLLCQGFDQLYSILVGGGLLAFTAGAALTGAGGAGGGGEEKGEGMIEGGMWSSAAVVALGKKCAALLLKVARFFLIGALSQSKPELYTVVQVRRPPNTFNCIYGAIGSYIQLYSVRSVYSVYSSTMMVAKYVCFLHRK